MLDDVPHLAALERSNRRAFPVAIAHFADAGVGGDGQVRVVLLNRLGRLHRPLQRAGVEVGDGRFGQPPAERFGLGFAFVVEVNARRPSCQPAGLDEVIDGVAHEQNLCHRVCPIGLQV